MTTQELAPYPLLTGSEPCREPGADPEDWFAETAAAIARAQWACRRCPVRPACLAYALDHPRETADGIWAASTPARRPALRAAYLTYTTEQDTE